MPKELIIPLICITTGFAILLVISCIIVNHMDSKKSFGVIATEPIKTDNHEPDINVYWSSGYSAR